ncbi:MAG: hypothetical protein ACOYMG_05710 [Candidatus Methylumidiphilus sp.]
MKTISENMFKNRLFAIFSELESSGEEVLVMADGQLALKLISYHRELVDDGGESLDYYANPGGLFKGPPTPRRISF